MKKIVLSTVTATTLMLLTTGCGDSTTKTETTVKTTQSKSVATTKRVSKEDREKALRARIDSYAKYGFDINQTADDSYILTIKEPSKSVDLLLSIFSLNLTVQDEEKKELQEVLDGTQFDVKIDWDRYVANQKDSVEVNIIGRADINSTDPLIKLLKDKKVGAYLTYNDKDELKKIDIKDIDELLTQDNTKATIKLTNAFVDIEQTPTKTSDKRVYTLNAGKLNIQITDESNITSTMGYKDITCKIDKSNAYLGLQECKAPTLYLKADNKTTSPMSVSLTNSSYSYDIKAKDKKVSEEIAITIDGIDINSEISLKNLKLLADIKNIDEDTIKSYMSLMENPSSNYKDDMKKLISLAGKMYSNGMSLHYDGSIETIDATLDRLKVNLQDYHITGDGKADSQLNYHEKSNIKKLSILDSKNSTNNFVLDNFSFGYGIKNLYNFIPESMSIISEVSTEENSTKIEETLQKDGTSLANKTLNYGVGFEINPISLDNLKITNYTLSDTDFNLDITLKKNNLNINDLIQNPMIALTLLKANGKLVVPIKDLQTLAQQPELAMLGMLMMFAKIEDKNAIFVLKFENGKLTVNDKPIM